MLCVGTRPATAACRPLVDIALSIAPMARGLARPQVCLLDQTYLIEDNAGSVSKVLKAASADLGADVSLCGLLRFHVGETGATPTDE